MLSIFSKKLLDKDKLSYWLVFGILVFVPVYMLVVFFISYQRSSAFEIDNIGVTTLEALIIGIVWGVGMYIHRRTRKK